jgi:hypothetical protein
MHIRPTEARGTAFLLPGMQCPVHNRQLAANQPHKEHNFSFPWSGENSSACGCPARAPLSGAHGGVLRALVRGTPNCATDFTLAEIADGPGATSTEYARGGGGVMPDQDDVDAMTKAWTYAVLDALEAADEKTRLEIVRILCPAGFVIVPAETMRMPRDQQN